MNRAVLIFSVTALSLLFPAKLAAQCVPDEGCVDVNQPGEICPSRLPEGVLNEPYDEVITVIPPKTYVYQGNPINIGYITIDSVVNLPPGIAYTPNSSRFYPDTSYCVAITGTPTAKGDYQLSIYVGVYVYIMSDYVRVAQVMDDTSVVMPVTAGTGIIPMRSREFSMIQAHPNPFMEKTTIGFYLPFDSEVELKVYNIVGEEVYKEVMFGVHGENHFEFTGVELDRGAYFYGITYKSKLYSGKFIKTH